MPLGFAAVGPLAEAAGVGTVLWAGAAWVVLSTAAVLALPAIRGVRRTEAQLAQQPA